MIQQILKGLWAAIQFCVLLIIALSGMEVFLAGLFYWTRLTFTSPRPVTSVDTYLSLATVVSGNLFLVILTFMGIRIAWVGWTSVFRLLDKVTVAALLDQQLSAQGLSESKRTALQNKLMKHLSAPVMGEESRLYDGSEQLIRLLTALGGIVRSPKTRSAKRKGKIIIP